MLPAGAGTSPTDLKNLLLSSLLDAPAFLSVSSTTGVGSTWFLVHVPHACLMRRVSAPPKGPSPGGQPISTQPCHRAGPVPEQSSIVLAHQVCSADSSEERGGLRVAGSRGVLSLPWPFPGWGRGEGGEGASLGGILRHICHAVLPAVQTSFSHALTDASK